MLLVTGYLLLVSFVIYNQYPATSTQQPDLACFLIAFFQPLINLNL
jgi:hypothetical protein